MDVEKIMTEGVVFKKASGPKPKEDKVKTKAKKKNIYYWTSRFGCSQDEGGDPPEACESS